MLLAVVVVPDILLLIEQALLLLLVAPAIYECKLQLLVEVKMLDFDSNCSNCFSNASALRVCRHRLLNSCFYLNGLLWNNVNCELRALIDLFAG